MKAITGKLTPLHDKVLVTDMNFGEERTAAGLILSSDNGKGEGVHPRWCRVWAVGPNQIDVKVNDWLLVDHGRWTRTIEYLTDTGERIELRSIDLKGILLVSDTAPTGADVVRVVKAAAGGNFNFNIPSAL